MIVAALVEYCLKSEARKDTTAPNARESRLYKTGSRGKYSLIAIAVMTQLNCIGAVTSVIVIIDLLAADHRQGSLSLGFKMLAGPWILNRQYGTVAQSEEQ